MSLKWLEARHFRNLTHISVDLDPGLNLLFGDNGSGKTVSSNPAIFFLPPGPFVTQALTLLSSVEPRIVFCAGKYSQGVWSIILASVAILAVAGK